MPRLVALLVARNIAHHVARRKSAKRKSIGLMLRPCRRRRVREIRRARSATALGHMAACSMRK